MTRAMAAAGLVLTGAGLVQALLRLGERRRVSPARANRFALARYRDAPPRLAAALADADVPWPPELVWTSWLAVPPVMAGLAVVVGGPALAAVAALASGGAPLLALAAGRGRAGRRADAALPALLDGVARSLRSGATLRTALGEQAGVVGGRLGSDLRAVLAVADGGRPLVVALDRWPVRCPTPGVRLAVAALGLSAEAGGAAARAIDGVAATLRANLAVAGEIRAQAAQARLSALVIALAPLAFGLLAASADGRTADFLLRSPVGVLCLLLGLGLDALGAWWMHRITAVAT